MNKGLTITLFALIFIGLTGVIMYYIYDNKYVTINNLYEAQVAQDQIVYDEVWKVIQQQAGVSEKYSDDFRRNYRDIMNARNYGGEMMKWITEQNPTFDASMYAKLMNTIESQRSKFTTVQTKLISIHNELKNLLTLFPSRFFLVTIGGHILPELKIVTSTRTDNAFQTGKDDNVDLFQKDTTRH